MRAAVLMLVLSAGLFACSSHQQKADRAPNQEHVHPGAPTPTPEFIAAEEDVKQHSFIFPDPKGHFGYHVSQFHANHQHQFIVKGKLLPASNEARVRRPSRNGYYSVTTDMPKFKLSKLLTGTPPMTENVDIFDGLIITRPQRRIVTEAKYVIEEKLFENTMYANDTRMANSVYIVFGSYGSAKKTHYLAHLIKAANNFEQILVVDFDKDLVIPNGVLMAIGQADNIPLAEKKTYEGQIDGQPVKFTVKRQVYFDKRTAAGYTDPQ